jgi:Mrp family chromosome partitioning ATPase/capsular polysaccharide biosynthesis protein
MSLEQYLTIAIKHWKLIFICFVLVGVGSFTGSKFLTRYYQSTALVEIAISSGTNQIDYTSLLASDQLVQTEAVLAISDPVLREVASHYSGLTVEELLKEVSASSKPNTQLFQIDVQDPSPTQAAALANDVAATLIKQQNEQFQLNSAQSGIYLLQVQPAQPNFNAVRPNTLVNTGAGLLAGLFLGMLLAVLFEMLDVRVRTAEALTQLAGWSVLATIWRASSNEDVVNPTGRNANVEAFRILRTNIGFAGVDKPLRTLMTTSAVPRDGKSVVAANLAIFMARAGKKTLLIDADLRRPVQHELFGIPGDAMGLSNAILAFSMPSTDHLPAYHQFTATTPALPAGALTAAKTSLDPFIHSVDIPNLCVMPSGPLPPNPPELLDSIAMQRLFAALASCGTEIVIFDAPPLLGLSDASILASKVDGALVIVDISQARKGNLKQVKTILEQAGAHVLGCVVNKQRRGRKGTIYSYYYYTDGRDNKGKRSTGRVNSPAASPTRPDAPKGLEAGSRQDLSGKNTGRDRNSNNASSPAAPAKTIDAPDQLTIKLPLTNSHNNKGRHNANNVNLLAVLPTTPDAPKGPAAGSRQDLSEKDIGRNHGSNNASSPVAPAKNLDIPDQLTSKLPLAHEREDEQREDG